MRDSLPRVIEVFRYADEADERAADDLAELDALRAKSRPKGTPWAAVICFILAVAGAALYTHFQSVAYICLAAAFCIAAVVLFMRYSKARRAALDARAERRKILDGYGVRSASDIRAALARAGLLATPATDEP